jgi:hypothetical protein
VCWDDLPQLLFNIFTYHSTMPSNSRWRGVTCVLLIPRCCSTSCISYDWKFWPWSVFSSLGSLKQ